MTSGCQWLPHRLLWWQHDSNPAEIQQQATVQKLLAQGDLAFEKDRLSVPAEDNAVLYYKQVLQLDAGNVAAKKGLVKVARRYCDLALTANGNGDKRLAQKYLHRAEDINGSTAETETVRKQLQDTVAGKNPRNLQLKRSVSNIIDKHKPQQTTDMNRHSQTLEKDANQP
ncbi:MAG TPA: hypothetical protein PLF22_08580 [Pseudomonadales bacterium]|nr:hypothetical protein [Pseudomonadales bacterium]